ncbi:MAG: hypothetical protein NVSMB45_11480 [Ginsengibacter sp.]
MKKFLIALSVLLFCFTLLTNAQEKVKIKDGKMKVKGSAMTPPLYTAAYSSDYSIADKKYSDIILTLWQDYENNTLMAHDFFADTVTIMMADGNIIHGKQQMGQAIGGFRNSLKSVSTSVHAWVPLHSNDLKTNVVCIWGSETDTYPDGHTAVQELHEVWFFNKDGKISLMRQWAAKMPAM